MFQPKQIQKVHSHLHYSIHHETATGFSVFFVGCEFRQVVVTTTKTNMDTQWWALKKVTPFRHCNSLVSMLYIWGVMGGLGPGGLDSWDLLMKQIVTCRYPGRIPKHQLKPPVKPLVHSGFATGEGTHPLQCKQGHLVCTTSLDILTLWGWRWGGEWWVCPWRNTQGVYCIIFLQKEDAPFGQFQQASEGLSGSSSKDTWLVKAPLSLLLKLGSTRRYTPCLPGKKDGWPTNGDF